MCWGANISCWFVLFILGLPPPTWERARSWHSRRAPLETRVMQSSWWRRMFNLSRHSGLLRHTISVVLEIVQFIRHRHNKWGYLSLGDFKRGLVFMEYTVIRASSNSNNKLLFFKTKTTFWFPSKIITCLINTKILTENSNNAERLAWIDFF